MHCRDNATDRMIEAVIDNIERSKPFAPDWRDPVQLPSRTQLMEKTMSFGVCDRLVNQRGVIVADVGFDLRHHRRDQSDLMSPSPQPLRRNQTGDVRGPDSLKRVNHIRSLRHNVTSDDRTQRAQLNSKRERLRRSVRCEFLRSYQRLILAEDNVGISRMLVRLGFCSQAKHDHIRQTLSPRFLNEVFDGKLKSGDGSNRSTRPLVLGTNDNFGTHGAFLLQR